MLTGETIDERETGPKDLSAVEIENLHFPWKRYWLPVDIEIQAGWGKAIFLPDPEDKYERYYNPLASSLEELGKHRLLVLCGDPASGKTTEINHHYDERASDVLLVRFRDVLDAGDLKDRCFESKKWKDLAKRHRPLRLVIESLDEGKVQFPTIFDRILREIEDLDLKAKQRLGLVLTCRSYDWQLLQGREPELRRALGLEKRGTAVRTEAQVQDNRDDYLVWKLCPLRQRDAEMAAKMAWSSGGENLLEEIFERGMPGFAAWPHTLKMVLREFASGALKVRSRRQLYENYSRELCSYHRSSDANQQAWNASLDRRFLVTKQLAALLLCSGKKYICLNRGTLAESEIGIWEITAASLSSFGQYSLSEEDVRMALQTANFAEFGPQRFGFNQMAHQECLAAGYLGDLSITQLRSLFFRSDFLGKHIVPGLQQTASWIAEYHREFREDIMGCNPTVLLRTDVTDLPEDCKPALFDKMMRLAETGEFVNSGRFFFGGLRHLEIAQQFRRYLSKADLNDSERELLFDILRQVAPLEMKDELLARCKSNWKGDRYYLLASLALISIATASGAETLVELLNDSEFLEGDVDLNVRGRLLQKLVPSRLPAREAFQWIQPNANLERGPSFYMFVEMYLPAAMTEEDVPAGLVFLSGLKKWPTGNSAREKLADKIVLMALDHLGNPAIASLLARQWMKRSDDEDYFDHFAERGEVREHLAADETLRRSFATLLLNSCDEFTEEGGSSFHMVWSTILVATDLHWVLGQVGKSDGILQMRWAMLFAANFNWSRSSVDFFEEHHEELFAVWDLAPPLRTALSFVFRPIEIDSDYARQEKERHRKLEEFKRKGTRAGQQKPWKKVVKKHLAEIPREPGFWVYLAETLRFDVSWKAGTAKDDDDDRLVGWRFLEEDQKAAALEGARQFLLTKRPSADVTPDSGTNYSEAAGPAVELLLDELATRFDLAAAIEEKWISSVIWHGFMNRTADKQRVVDVFYRRWPDAVIAALRHDVETFAKKDEGFVLLRLHGFERSFDDRLYSLIEDFLRNDIRAATAAEIGEWLVEHRPAYFLNLLQKTTELGAGFSNSVRFSLLAVGIKQMPRETWRDFEKVVFADESGKQVIWESASIDLVRRTRGFDGVLDSELGRLYKRVVELYPPEETPPHKSGFQARHSLNRVAEFRGLITQELTDRATAESVAELLRLRRDLPSLADHLLWKVYQATENFRTQSWAAPSVEALAKVILSPATCHLAETSESLLDVVISSLERLQRRLTGSKNPRVLDFWRKGVGGPPSNRENRGPYYEEDISWRLAAWLQDDLQTWSSFLVGREVQPRWDERTDITVDALPTGSMANSESHPSVVIEVKGAWHAEVDTAAVTQLIDDYLAHQLGAAGLYVVCWFGADFFDEGKRRNRLKARTLSEARVEVSEIVEKAMRERPGYVIKGVLLDFSLGDEGSSPPRSAQLGTRCNKL